MVATPLTCTAFERKLRGETSEAARQR